MRGRHPKKLIEFALVALSDFTPRSCDECKKGPMWDPEVRCNPICWWDRQDPRVLDLYRLFTTVCQVERWTDKNGNQRENWTIMWDALAYQAMLGDPAIEGDIEPGEHVRHLRALCARLSNPG